MKKKDILLQVIFYRINRNIMVRNLYIYCAIKQGYTDHLCYDSLTIKLYHVQIELSNTTCMNRKSINSGHTTYVSYETNI